MHSIRLAALRIAAVSAALALPAFANTIHVPADQLTIQAGVNAASTGDTVLVAPGTYFESISFNGRAITVTSSAGPATTIIDGGGTASPIVLFNQAETSTSILSGFTIRHDGPSVNLSGIGGIYIAASPIVEGNIVTQNVCTGIYVSGGTAIIRNNQIDHTTAPTGIYCGTESYGNGIVVRGGHPTIASNTIEQNLFGLTIDVATGVHIDSNTIRNNTGSTGSESYGITLYNTTGFLFTNNLIYGNTNGIDLAIPYSYAAPTASQGVISANTIANNTEKQVWLEGFPSQDLFINNIVYSTSNTYPAISCDSYPVNGFPLSVPADIDHNDLFNTHGIALSSSCFTPTDPSSNFGNLFADPLFSSAGDYSLLPGSPAIDSGSNSDLNLDLNDLHGNPRVQNTVVDRGAIESSGVAATFHTKLALTSPYYLAPGAPITLLAGIGGDSGTSGVSSTGPITFYEDGSGASDIVGQSNLTGVSTGDSFVQAEARLTLNNGLTPGVHSFTATYAGDINFTAATAPKYFVLVTGYSPTLTIASSANPSNFGDAITFTVTAPTNEGIIAPITLTDGAITLASLTPNTTTGIATFTTSALTLGPHTITAAYAGDSAHSSTSINLTQQVNPPLAVTSTTLAVTSGGNVVTTVATGSAVTLTATVTVGAAPLHPGQVNFCDATAATCTGIHILATAQLNAAGTASYRFIPAIGVHLYKAVFLGTSVDAPNSSAASSLTVTGKYSTVTTLASTGVPGNYTLIATVSGSGPLAPTGTVSFLDTTNANYLLGTATLTPNAPITGFVNSSSPATPNEPISTSVSDFNGDGIPDIAVVNEFDGATPSPVTILLGNGDGTFTAAASPLAGILSTAIVTGDFNNDGKADLAIANELSNTVTILLGNGDGTFTPAATSPATGTHPEAITIGDFNHDGNADLAVSNTDSGTVTILLGHGDGTFTAAPSPSIGSRTNPVGIVVGDFNNDGNQDLAVMNYGLSIATILLGNGDGTFNAVTPNATTGGFPIFATVGDFNGDGNADLAVAANSDIEVLLGKGDGTFNPPAIIASGEPEGTTVGDFNKDGKLDLAVADFSSRTARIFIGHGDGTFTESTPSPAGPGVSSVAVADFNSDGNPDLVLANLHGADVTVLLGQSIATATLQNISPIGTGTHLVDATYPGDTTYNSSTSNIVPLIAEPVGTTTTLTSSLNPTGVNVPTTLTATVSSTTGTPNGTVIFTEGATTLGTSPLVAGVATLPYTSAIAGPHTITATFNDPTNGYTGSTSAPLTQTITAITTSTSLFSNPTAYVGNTITFNPIVTLSGAGPTATGTVSLKDGVTVIATSPLTGSAICCMATFSINTLSLGAHTLTAAYSGDQSYSSSSSTPITITILINPTTLTLNASPNPSRAFVPVTLSAQIASSTTAAIPTGVITFLANGNPIGSGTLNASGLATFTTPLPANTYIITATYNANTTFAAATSNTATQTVNPDPTLITLTAAPSPGTQNQPVTLTATVTATSSATVPPGTVTFYDGATTLLTAPLDAAGHALFTTSTLAVGLHHLTATYNPTGTNFLASTTLISTALTINPQYFTLTTPSTLSIQTEHHASLNITLTSIGGFTDDIALTCGNLPAVATCTFSNSKPHLNANATLTTTVVIDTDAVHYFKSNLSKPPSPQAPKSPFERLLQPTGLTLAMLLPLGLVALRRRNNSSNETNQPADTDTQTHSAQTHPGTNSGSLRHVRLLSTILCTIALAAAALNLTGCSGKYPDHTPPGTYTITIQGQGRTTGLNQTATVTFTVTQ